MVKALHDSPIMATLADGRPQTWSLTTSGVQDGCYVAEYMKGCDYANIMEPSLPPFQKAHA